MRGLTRRRPRFDFLIGQQRVVDTLALEIAVAHHFRAAQYLRVEFERAIHVLDREAEMLHALKPCAQRPFVAICRRSRLRALCRRRRRDAGPRCSQPGQHRGASAAKRIAALEVDRIQVDRIQVLLVTHPWISMLMVNRPSRSEAGAVEAWPTDASMPPHDGVVIGRYC